MKPCVVHLERGRNWISYEGYSQREDGFYLWTKDVNTWSEDPDWIWAPGSAAQVILCYLCGAKKNNPLYAFGGNIVDYLTERDIMKVRISPPGATR